MLASEGKTNREAVKMPIFPEFSLYFPCYQGIEPKSETSSSQTGTPAKHSASP